eukprot:2488570-Amphidinium_carterae.1
MAEAVMDEAGYEDAADPYHVPDDNDEAIHNYGQVVGEQEWLPAPRGLTHNASPKRMAQELSEVPMNGPWSRAAISMANERMGVQHLRLAASVLGMG